MFNLSFSSRAKKFFKKADKKLCKRILDKVEKLRNDPVPHDAKTIEGSPGMFRIRVGDHRILYEIYNAETLIVIVNVDKRSCVYNRL